jgi:hypothetical protein
MGQNKHRSLYPPYTNILQTSSSHRTPTVTIHTVALKLSAANCKGDATIRQNCEVEKAEKRMDSSEAIERSYNNFVNFYLLLKPYI